MWAKKLKAFSLKQVAAARVEEEEEEEEEEEVCAGLMHVECFAVIFSILRLFFYPAGRGTSSQERRRGSAQEKGPASEGGGRR